MILAEWNRLPDELKNQKVKYYYDILARKKVHLIYKRIFDFICAICMLIVLSPILILISVAIKMDSKGPVFFRQERVTQYGRVFKIYKFRTMVNNADKLGTLVTVHNDTRITRVGNLIRKYRIDEIPQLINIIKGDMSFVGTRPEVKKYVDKYSEEMYATLLLPAGVTSKASIEFKNEDNMLKSTENIDEIYIRDILPIKMKYNLQSIEKFNIIEDIRIIFHTVYAVVKK